MLKYFWDNGVIPFLICVLILFGMCYIAWYYDDYHKPNGMKRGDCIIIIREITPDKEYIYKNKEGK